LMSFIFLSKDEYKRLVETVKKLDMIIREAVKEAILKWTEEKSGIEPADPIFNLTPISYEDEEASTKVDETLYK